MQVFDFQNATLSSIAAACGVSTRTVSRRIEAAIGKFRDDERISKGTVIEILSIIAEYNVNAGKIVFGDPVELSKERNELTSKLDNLSRQFDNVSKERDTLSSRLDNLSKTAEQRGDSEMQLRVKLARTETELEYQSRTADSLSRENATLKEIVERGVLEKKAIQADSADASALSTKLEFALEKASKFDNADLMLKSALSNLDSLDKKNAELLTVNKELSESVSVLKKENSVFLEKILSFESSSNSLKDFVINFTQKYKGIIIAIGYLNWLAVAIIGYREIQTFYGTFVNLNMFAWVSCVFAVLLTLLSQGAIVEKGGLTCAKIWLNGWDSAKKPTEKIMDKISVAGGVIAVAIMFMVAQNVYKSSYIPPKKNEVLLSEIAQRFKSDTSDILTRYRQDTSRIGDSVRLAIGARNVEMSKRWTSAETKNNLGNANELAVLNWRKRLNDVNCASQIANVTKKYRQDIDNAPTIQQMNNQVIALSVFLFMVLVRIASLIVIAVQEMEGVQVAPKKLRHVVRDAWRDLWNII